MLILGAQILLGFLWYGLPRLRKRYKPEQEHLMRFRDIEKPSSTPLDVKIEHMLTEARVILPGAQALFGFQLAIVFTQSFGGLATARMFVHATSLLLIALAVVLLMAPAACHRIVYEGEVSADMLQVGSVLVMVATIPLALGLAGDTYVVIGKITTSPTVAERLDRGIDIENPRLVEQRPHTIIEMRLQPLHAHGLVDLRQRPPQRIFADHFAHAEQRRIDRISTSRLRGAFGLVKDSGQSAHPTSSRPASDSQ
jgi:hypothetical protein